MDNFRFINKEKFSLDIKGKKYDKGRTVMINDNQAIVSETNDGNQAIFNFKIDNHQRNEILKMLTDQNQILLPEMLLNLNKNKYDDSDSDSNYISDSDNDSDSDSKKKVESKKIKKHLDKLKRSKRNKKQNNPKKQKQLNLDKPKKRNTLKIKPVKKSISGKKKVTDGKIKADKI